MRWARRGFPIPPPRATSAGVLKTNLIEQLKNRVRSMRNPLDNLHGNWAYMVIASLAWTLKAFRGLMPPTPKGRWQSQHQQQKQELLKMEFKRFVVNLIRLPCQIIKTGRRLIYRLLSETPGRARCFEA